MRERMREHFIGDFKVPDDLCESLIALHKAAYKKGLVKRGALGTAQGVSVDVKQKDSYDLGLVVVPDDMLQHYRVPEYYQALKHCVDQYFEQYPSLRSIGPFSLAESPIVQYYRPGGGYKKEHFERTGMATTTRMLTWMTYLNDVSDAGGTRFTYQDITVDARRGRTVIWPTDFTHTHVGVVSPSQEKYIITGWLNYTE